MAFVDKYYCLARAKALLASGDAVSLRYACLELRFCMEAGTYEKLRAYASRLPPNVLSIWQPPQAVKALLELEGEADQEYTVAFGLAGSAQPMQVMGEHRTFATTWLRKHYNKLGSFLHVPNENVPDDCQQPVNAQQLQNYLTSVIVECERVVETSIISSIARVVEFNCQLCGRKIVANAEGAERRRRILCWHAECYAEHLVSTTEYGSLYFRLSGAVFPCQACSHQQFVPKKYLVPDHQFACDACGRSIKLWTRCGAMLSSASTRLNPWCTGAAVHRSL